MSNRTETAKQSTTTLQFLWISVQRGRTKQAGHEHGGKLPIDSHLFQILLQPRKLCLVIALQQQNSTDNPLE
jgi:hypothetical protein